MIESIRITPFSLAQRFIGLREVSGKTANPAILAMLQLDNPTITEDEVPWCSAFMNYVAWLLRLPRSKSLAARSWLDVGIPIDISQAEPGFDVCIFSRDPAPSGHVALFAANLDPMVSVLGGNQSDSVSVASYPKNRLLGVRRLAA